MKSFYNKDEYTFADIISLIDNEVEESIYLDFKDGNALDKSDSKRKDISKDVSSFANSDGGIIIYGITESNHKASKLSFVDGDEFSKEWLEQIINSTIQRHIPDLLIFPLRQDGDIKRSVYIVKIPKSLEAPHLSRDKKFYKRFNFESVPMEEYEIRNSYGRKAKSKLFIAGCSLAQIKDDIQDDVNELHIKVEIKVVNEGDIVETNYKVNCYFENLDKPLSISYHRDLSNYDYTRLDANRIKLSATGISPIYPDEAVNALRCEMVVPLNSARRILEGKKIVIKLYYVNGEDDMEMPFDEFLESLSL